MIKNILIDFHNTICFDKFLRSIKEREYNLISELLFQKNTEMINDWMIGKYTSEDIGKFVSEQTGLDYKYIWNNFIEDCKTMYVDAEVINLIKQVRGNGYKVFLVTDNMDCFDRFTLPALKLDLVFDAIYNSYNYKCLKSTGLFDEVKKVENIDFTQSIMIDDSKSVIDTFKSLGGACRTVTSINDVKEILSSI